MPARSLPFPVVALLRGVLALVLLMALAGCGDKVSPENHARVAKGMTQAEVEKILGTPSESRNQLPPAGIGLSNEDRNALMFTESKWRGKNGRIVVVYSGGKVTSSGYFPPGTPEEQRRP